MGVRKIYNCEQCDRGMLNWEGIHLKGRIQAYREERDSFGRWLGILYNTSPQDEWENLNDKMVEAEMALRSSE